MKNNLSNTLRIGAAALLLELTLAGCVRPEPGQGNATTPIPTTNPPAEVTPDTETAQITSSGEINLTTQYPQSELLLLPGLENQRLITETSYIRHDGVPVITESIGLENMLIVSPHAIAELVNRAMGIVGTPILEANAQEEVENVTLQLREGANRPIRVRFYNADLVDAALQNETMVSASREIAAHYDIVNEVVIDVPVVSGMSDFQLNATVARAVLLSLFTTNVTENWVYEGRDTNLTDLLVNSAAYAFAYNQTGRSYKDYSDNFAFRTTEESGFSGYDTDPVNLSTYWAFQDLYPLVYIQ